MWRRIMNFLKKQVIQNMPRGITHDEYLAKFYKKFSLDYKIKNVYKNKRTYIKIKHNIKNCGFSWEVLPLEVLKVTRNTICPECRVIKATNDFKKQVYKLVSKEYIVLGKYTGTNKPILMKHSIDECGYEWNLTPASFLGTENKKGSRCPKCQKKLKRNINMYKSEVYQLVGGEYEILSTYYKNNKTPLLVRHNNESCINYEWEVTPVNFLLRGERCPKCNPKNNWGTQSRAITPEEFNQIVNKIGKGQYVALETFKSVSISILMKHTAKNCGHEWKVKPSEFLGTKNRNGTRCPACFGNNRKTTEHFIKEIEYKWGNDYLVLSEYINSSTPIKIKHLKNCNYEWESAPKSLLNSKHGCPICYGNNMKKNTDQFKDDVYKRVGNNYVVLGEYINAHTPLLMKHNNDHCNYYEWKTDPNSFLNGNRCPKCSGVMKKEIDIIKEELREIIGEEYIIVGEYINYKTSVKVIHNIPSCMHEWDAIPQALISQINKKGQYCPNCAGNIKSNTQQYIQEVKKEVGTEYIVLGEYINIDTPVLMKHNLISCGFEWSTTPYVFLRRGSRCPRCRESKGEKRITKYLQEQLIKFTAQYSFDECRYDRKLYFDFVVFNDNNEIRCLIEYDGLQHFEAVDNWGGEDALKLIKIRDGVKNDFCRKNMIPLIRIPYWDYDDIESILEDKLKNTLYS